MNKVVVIYSGGMDSYTLLHWALAEGFEVHALSFNYGQRHRKELDKAKDVTVELGLVHKVVDVTSINTLLQGSSLTSPEMAVPEGHYADEESMKQTVVPNRNMVMLSLAIGYAVSVEADAVMFGAHAGDHAIYPDCRGEFISAIDALAQIANYRPIRVFAPFITMDKGDIAIMGKELGLDYSKSWTCYKGEAKPCGKCGACVERAEAMAKAGIKERI